MRTGTRTRPQPGNDMTTPTWSDLDHRTVDSSGSRRQSLKGVSATAMRSQVSQTRLRPGVKSGPCKSKFFFTPQKNPGRFASSSDLDNFNILETKMHPLPNRNFRVNEALCRGQILGGSDPRNDLNSPRIGPKLEVAPHVGNCSNTRKT